MGRKCDVIRHDICPGARVLRTCTVHSPFVETIDDVFLNIISSSLYTPLLLTNRQSAGAADPTELCTRATAIPLPVGIGTGAEFPANGPTLHLPRSNRESNIERTFQGLNRRSKDRIYTYGVQGHRSASERFKFPEVCK